MPKQKIELIRLQQEAVVNNLLTIARYTNTKPIYTEMTHDEFKKTMRNLDHILTICTRSIRACRHGQNLAPKVGPLSHYYRLFEDFGEILHLESDKILTLKEYLPNHRKSPVYEIFYNIIPTNLRMRYLPALPGIHHEEFLMTVIHQMTPKVTLIANLTTR
jgi:hypothetical protein